MALIAAETIKVLREAPITLDQLAYSQGSVDTLAIQTFTNTVTALHVMDSNDNSVFIVDTLNQRVGIGDETPDAKLDVALSTSTTTAGTQIGSQVSVSDTGAVNSGTDTTYGQQISVTRQAVQSTPTGWISKPPVRLAEHQP
jgi:hypothetical protein